MRYQFDTTDGIEIIDTKNINYDYIWRVLGFNKKQQEGANKIIDLYNFDNFNEKIFIITAHSRLKLHNREKQRHQADQYKTLNELLKTAKNNKVIRKLISEDILEIHSKWVGFNKDYRKHPQTPYKLNIPRIHGLEEDKCY